MKKTFAFVLLLLSGIQVLKANVVLPAIFGNGMVLQQKEKVKVWGKATPNSMVSIITSWDKVSYHTRADATGNWNTKIQTPKAGGPYEISLNDGAKLVVKDILIGEVWLCSGQSNMEMPIKGYGNQPVLNSNDILMDADEPGVRLFRIEKNTSRTPLTELAVKWQHANAASVKEFSAIGYQFARLLQQKLNVPVGIIQSAYGGTDIEAWMTKKSLDGFSDFKNPPDTAKIIKNDPAVLFNAMINPIIGFQLKGVLWYQGENNRFNPLTYDRKMAAMVAEWRKLWNIGDWPFYYVQIAPNIYKDVKENIPLLYEAQAKASKLIPNSGMVVSVDAGSNTTIHPPNKTIISKRLLYWALAKQYAKEGIAYRGPIYKTLKITGDKAVVSFDYVALGLTSYDQKIISFEIAGEDKVFYPADAVVVGRTIAVTSTKVKEPLAVRYAFKDSSAGNLYNVEGLPLAPFRTDTW
ncbi:sialate O-acetylesterase [Pedobacter sp. Du54]|uniref:sialate O-acetylesterase n=1 Tax=Pedobacter anseongensis TaxID=3133439 RepID=UPI0030A06E92